MGKGSEQKHVGEEVYHRGDAIPVSVLEVL